MLLNILQCIGQPPTTKNYLAQNSVKVEKHWLRKTMRVEESGLCKHPVKPVRLNDFGRPG